MNLGLKHRLIYFLRREQVFDACQELVKTNFYSSEKLHDYKQKKIDSLTRHACQKIPFYQSATDLTKDQLPIIDKDAYRRDIRAFISAHEPISWRSTSGTTGSPFVFPKDRHASAYMDAMMYLAYAWHGIKPSDKQARIWGRPLKKKAKLMQSFKDLVLNRRRLSAFEMDASGSKRFYYALQRFNPKYFYAYSNALYHFAISLENAGLNGRALGIRVAICTGEVLFEHQRKKIAEIFGCRVVNEYGSTENGIIGFECEFGNMHVMPTVSIEIDDPDEQGCGEIVVTELNSRSLPFIRYRNGDRGRLLSGLCPCRRPYEVMEVQEGRIDDYIRCPDGRVVYDAILAYSLKEYALQFKAYQESAARLKICLVPSSRFDREAEVTLRKTLGRYLGEEMEIELSKVDRIEPDKSGKFRYFVSRLQAAGDVLDLQKPD